MPGRLDVYGVTIPGLPAVLIGFNRDVAWTFTNVEADLMDRWVEEVDDSLHPAHYRVDGAWMPLELRAESYRDPRGQPMAAGHAAIHPSGTAAASRGHVVFASMDRARERG